MTQAQITDNETHPALNAQELLRIREYREKLAYKTPEESQRLLYEWTRTGKLTRYEHILLCKYIYQSS